MLLNSSYSGAIGQTAIVLRYTI